MGEATIPAKGGGEDHVRARSEGDPGVGFGTELDVDVVVDGGADGGGTCGVLGQMDDERLHLMGLVIRANRQLTDRLGRDLEDTVGIPLVFFDVLIHVGAAPEGRLTMSRLSADVALTTGGVTRLVDRMVDAGLVERQNCPNDRRSVHVVLTAAGRGVLEKAVAAHIEGIDRYLMEPLDPRDRVALEVALTKVLDAGF
jgi:MarR family transcriptional regulator, 2-MHQ and catechol-resistance regulon repressor